MLNHEDEYSGWTLCKLNHLTEQSEIWCVPLGHHHCRNQEVKRLENILWERLKGCGTIKENKIAIWTCYCVF